MGSEESTLNTEMENVDINIEQKKKLQRSTNKPNPNYAKLAKQKPITPKVVQLVRSQFDKKLQFNKTKQTVQELPMFEMIKTGIFYKGCWYAGKQHGEGQIFTKNGVYFHGQFNNGVADCRDGLLIFPDGSYYKGNFNDNSFNGKGALRHEEYNGDKFSQLKFAYEGNWKENKPDGFGKQTYQDQSVYEGNFSKGKKHGLGKFKWPNGKIYEGNFVQGHMHGQGKLSFRNSEGESHFKGTFQSGLKTKGELTTQKGTYLGNYKYGLMHDEKAKFTWNDGKVYEGGFQFGQMHGDGCIIFPNNQTVVGKWQHGQNVRINQIRKSVGSQN